MFGIDSSEFLLVALVALVVIGPKDLPKAMRVLGYWVGRARGVARQFRSGFDSMVREAELEEMEKKWAAENARIMREPAAPLDEAAVHDAPVMVEKPVVEPAPEGTPSPRGDGVTS
jgi:sec-independent protein translocase protein TatB